MSEVEDVHSTVNEHGLGRNAFTVAIAGAVVGLLSGAALGVLWWALAPRVVVVVSENGLRPDGFQPQEYLAADIAFGALAVVAGLLVTIGLSYMRREHLVSTLFAALIASVLGTALMWLVGTRLGSVDLENLDLPAATTVQGPLEVHMPAMFLVWSLTSAAVITVLALIDFVTSVRSRGPQ